MKKIIIAAVSDNLAIGKDGELPWHMPADLDFFHKQIEGALLLSGRTSYESSQGSTIFTNRPFIVVTRRKGYTVDGGRVAHSIEEAFAIAGKMSYDRLCILGGGVIYEQTINQADEIIISEIHTIVEDADAFFPKIDQSIWKEYDREDYPGDEENPYNYSFVFYKKR
jgi:dihydrofolate reductase